VCVCFFWYYLQASSAASFLLWVLVFVWWLCSYCNFIFLSSPQFDHSPSAQEATLLL